MLAGAVDWDKISPEKLRAGVSVPQVVNWDALRLVMEKADMTPFQRRRQTDQLIKVVKRGGLAVLHPNLRASYCVAKLALGDFSDYWGWEFRDLNARDENARGWAAAMFWQETWLPKWGGGYVDRLLVIGEQGVGDVVFYASILPECMIRAKTVVYECEERLHSLLMRSLPGLICDREYPFDEYRAGDAFIPAADLMRMFRRDRKHFPGKAYLRPNPERVADFECYRGRTGISWVGRQGRIDPLALGVENPLSVQYGETHHAVETPPLDLKNDIEGVVALCSVLDRVVTVPTSVHHFAGASGCRVEIVVPPAGSGEATNQIAWDYSMAYGGKLPWYPDVTVYASIEAWKEKA